MRSVPFPLIARADGTLRSSPPLINELWNIYFSAAGIETQPRATDCTISDFAFKEHFSEIRVCGEIELANPARAGFDLCKHSYAQRTGACDAVIHTTFDPRIPKKYLGHAGYATTDDFHKVVHMMGNGYTAPTLVVSIAVDPEHIVDLTDYGVTLSELEKGLPTERRTQIARDIFERRSLGCDSVLANSKTLLQIAARTAGTTFELFSD